MVLFNTPAPQLREIHTALYAGFENKSLRVIVGQEYSLSEAAKAHEAVLKSGAYGKIILRP
jgi:NADPH2:quinone reductase